MLSRCYILSVCVLSMFSAFSQTSSFTKQPVAVEDSSNFSFTVSGHFHGASQNLTGYPASTLLANLDDINQSNTAFVVCLGDLFLDIKNNLNSYEKSLFSKLKKPLFNAVGNHDISGNIYQENFGDTYFLFGIGSNAFVVLDTELNDGSIKNEQMEMLSKALSNKNYINIFVFSHRLIWAEQDDKIAHLFKDNTRSYISNNFQKEILPLVEASTAKVYWFSGSLGGNAPSSFFYHPKSERVTFIATAIRDLPRDAVLNVHLKQNDVSFSTQSLTMNTVEPIEMYDVDYWTNYKPKAQKFNKRLLPMYIKNMFKHWMFWVGVAIGALLLLILMTLKTKLFGRN